MKMSFKSVTCNSSFLANDQQEFSTTIEVKGFRPKLLAVRSLPRSSHIISAALFRQHIYVLFTLLGLSLPYRIWFAKHCDEIRVTVVKETGSEERPSKEVEIIPKSSWFPGKWGWGSSQSPADIESKRNQELFRKSMQQFSLYEDKSTSSGKSVVNQTVKLVDVNAQPETASPVDKLRSESVCDDEPTGQESTSTSLDTSDTTLSSQDAISVDVAAGTPAHEQGSQSSTSVDSDHSLPESDNEIILDDASPDSISASTQSLLESPTSDHQDVQ
jgi:hypothetical protein